MDANTEILLNISKQLGLLTAKMENVEKFMADHKIEMAQLKEDLRTHEGIHLEVAPKKDIDELWVQIRKHDKILSELKNAPGESAIAWWKKAKDVFWASIIGAFALGFIAYIMWSIGNYFATGGKIN